MRSMTGFGSGTASDDAGRVTVQVAVVNHKQCQVQMRSDVRDVGLENGLRSRVRDALQRGSATVQLSWEPAQQLSVDLDALRAAWAEMNALAEDLGAPTPRLEDLARMQQRSGSVDVDLLRDLAERALDAALGQLDAMRQQEGAALETACRADAAALQDLQADMQRLAQARVPAYAERLRERLQEIQQALPPLREEDLVRELAIYADRIDVSEELVRLDSHFTQLDQLLAAEEPVGKRLEFLLQEIGREINTTGAKANDAELTRLVCAGKSVLERLKEQIANVL